jgi:hypothetical protein
VTFVDVAPKSPPTSGERHERRHLARRVVIHAEDLLVGDERAAQRVVAHGRLRVDEADDVEVRGVHARDRHERDLEQAHHRAVLGAPEHAAVRQRDLHPALLVQQLRERPRRGDRVRIGVVVGAHERRLRPVDDVEESSHVLADAGRGPGIHRRDRRSGATDGSRRRVGHASRREPRRGGDGPDALR